MTWTTSNEADAKQVRILVDLDGTQYSNGALQAPTGTAKPYLVSVSGVGGSVDPQTCVSQITGMSFVLADVSAEVTSQLYTRDVRGRACSVKLGYHDVDEGDFLYLMRGIVQTCSYSRGQWSITVGDLRRSAKRTIFTGATEGSPVTFTNENPVELALKILTSTGAGTNGAYDTLAAASGLGIDVALIDVAGCEASRDSWVPNVELDFTIQSPAEAKQFIEDEICRVCGLYLVTNPDGTLLLKGLAPPLWADQVVALTESNIVGIPEVSVDLRDLLNEFSWRRDYDAATQEFGSETIYLDSDSLAKFALSKRLEIDSYASDGVEDAFVSRRNRRLFSRWADPFPRYRLKALLAVNQVRPGSVVSLAHSKIPDLRDGTRGVDASDPLLCEVLSVRVDPLKSGVDLELVGTPWDAGEKYASIGEATDTEDYDDATAEQKQRVVYIADADNTIGTDDDDPYLIMPG